MAASGPEVYVYRSPLSHRGSYPLLATCHLLRAEASNLYFSAHTFRVPSQQDLKLWLNAIGPAHRGMLRDVRVRGMSADRHSALGRLADMHEDLAAHGVPLPTNVLHVHINGRKWTSMRHWAVAWR